MKVTAITGPRSATLIDRPHPRIQDDYVCIKVTVAPMCTEYKIYEEGTPTDTLGHEAAGVVAELARPGRVKLGDRVVVMPQYPCGKCALCIAGDYIYCEHNLDPLEACDSPSGASTYAQYLIKPDWLLIPIPEDIPTAHAAMACCGLGPTFGAMQRIGVDAFDTVLITGLGPVGLGGVINATYRGARVIGVESNPYRARMAIELGAELIIDPNDPDALMQLKSLTGGRGVDCVIECAGNPDAQKLALRAARRRGKVAFVGWGGHIEIDNMVPDGLTLQGSWHWNLRDTPRMLQVIRENRKKIERLITHRLPMSRVQEAFELQLSGQCGKVILDPWK